MKKVIIILLCLSLFGLIFVMLTRVDLQEQKKELQIESPIGVTGLTVKDDEIIAMIESGTLPQIRATFSVVENGNAVTYSLYTEEAEFYVVVDDRLHAYNNYFVYRIWKNGETVRQNKYPTVGTFTPVSADRWTVMSVFYETPGEALEAEQKNALYSAFWEMFGRF